MKRELVVAIGPATSHIGRDVSKELGLNISTIEEKLFNDGEFKLTLQSNFSRKEVLYFQDFYPEQALRLTQANFSAYAMNAQSANVHLIGPYFPFARQDKEWKKEVVSMQPVANLLESAGIKSLSVVDMHSEEAKEPFKIPVHDLRPEALLANYVASHYKLKDPIAISPDQGGKDRIRVFASALGCEYVAFKKSRNMETGEISFEKIRLPNLKGRDAVIKDDIVRSGTTIFPIAEILKRSGAERVILTFTHSLMRDGVDKKLKASGVNEIVTTDTIPNKYAKVSVKPLIVTHLRKLLGGSL